MDGAETLLTTALLLGFRHGFDWDHIAAITDIVGSMSGEQSGKFLRVMALSSAYALGHALVVAVLGVAALKFATILPGWVDPVMERIVGWTLLFLAAWLCYSLVQYARGKREFRLQSRWMILADCFTQFAHKLLRKLEGTSNNQKIPAWSAVFFIGALHGIGAETGTQVLLIAAIGGAINQGLGIGMLLMFVIGLLISNTLVAMIGAATFLSSVAFRPIYIAAGIVSCIFSFTVGTYFAFGQADRLPDIQQISLVQKHWCAK